MRTYCRTLHEELIGEPLRVTEVAPGLVDTELSLLRSGGDADRAAGVHTVTPMTADDVAEVSASPSPGRRTSTSTSSS